jgi:F-type H+-transporting ATPase subunit gamma
VDKVELLYNHFKSTATQILTREVYLPMDAHSGRSEGSREQPQETDYILEPSRDELLSMLLPKVLRMKLYTVLLDSNASEHAARTMAMQIATDNADDLLQELTLMYNKTRQQAITNELLDIVGGSMA